jgi:hypothetical protein
LKVDSVIAGARSGHRAAPACSCGRRPRRVRPGAGKARVRLDQREQAARRNVEARQACGAAGRWSRAPASGPCCQQQASIGSTDWAASPFGLEQPGADVEFVGAHVEDGVVEFARHCSGHQFGAGGFDGRRRRFRAGLRALMVKVAVRLRGRSHVTCDSAGRRRSIGALEGVSATPLPLAGRSLLRRVRARAPARRRRTARLGRPRPPGASRLGALCRARLRRGAEDVGEVVAHVALVGHARQAAGAGQHAEQRHFRQRLTATNGRPPDRSRRRPAPVRSRRRRRRRSRPRGTSGPNVAGRVFQAVAVSLVNLQKFTFQAWLETPSMKMLAPEQNTRSLPLVTMTVRTSGCSKRMRLTRRSVRCRRRGHSC